MTEDPSITFWFDASCPFTWRTSRWIRDVAARQGRSLQWQPMSLAILNEGKEIPEQYRQSHTHSRRAARLLIATGQRHGQAAVERLYTAIGVRRHDKGEPWSTELLTGALSDADLPADLIAAADDTALEEPLRESHDAGQARVGTESGSPILAIGDDRGFFGPVVVPIPEGEDADRLFEAVRLLAAVPQFSELKGSRNPF